MKVKRAPVEADPLSTTADANTEIPAMFRTRPIFYPRRVPHTGRSRLSGPAGRHWQEWKVRIRLDRECLSSRSQRLDLNGTYHCGHRYYSDGYRQPLDLKGTYH